MDIECSVLSWHSGRAGTGGTIWPIYNPGSGNSEDRKRPHSPQGSAFWKRAQSQLRSCPLSPSRQGQYPQHCSYGRQPFCLPLNIEKDCIMHQKREKKLCSCCRNHQWCDIKGFKKPVSTHRMLGKWPQTLFGLIFSALTPLFKLTYFFFFLIFFLPLVFNISNFKV